jgi:hypothetical protein
VAGPPLVIQFAAGSSLELEQDRPSQLPIYRNGPPGTFVRLGGLRISLPTDLIVHAHERDGAVVVGFGGMQFSGLDDGRMTFARVRDLWPEPQLSPARSWLMTLDPLWVSSVHENDCQLWPTTETR